MDLISKSIRTTRLASFAVSSKIGSQKLRNREKLRKLRKLP